MIQVFREKEEKAFQTEETSGTERCMSGLGQGVIQHLVTHISNVLHSHQNTLFYFIVTTILKEIILYKLEN